VSLPPKCVINEISDEFLAIVKCSKYVYLQEIEESMIEAGMDGPDTPYKVTGKIVDWVPGTFTETFKV